MKTSCPTLKQTKGSNLVFKGTTVKKAKKAQEKLRTMGCHQIRCHTILLT